MTLLALLGVVLVLFLAAVLVTRDGAAMAPAPQDAADVALPVGPFTPEDVRALRFGMAPRGYRMSEVDRVLDRLVEELADRDRRIAELGGAAAPAAPAPGTAPGPGTAPAPGTAPGPVTAPAPAPESVMAPAPLTAPAPGAAPPLPPAHVTVLPADSPAVAVPQLPPVAPRPDSLVDPLTDPLADPLPSGGVHSGGDLPPGARH